MQYNFYVFDSILTNEMYGFDTEPEARAFIADFRNDEGEIHPESETLFITKRITNVEIIDEDIKFFKYVPCIKPKRYVAVMCLNNQDFINYMRENVALVQNANDIEIKGKTYIAITAKCTKNRLIGMVFKEYIQTSLFYVSCNDELLNLVKQRIK